MSTDPGPVTLGSFAAVFGDVERGPRDIPGFDDLWERQGPAIDLERSGCRTLRTMSGPVDGYLAECLRATMAVHGLAGDAVDRLVLVTSDGCLGSLGEDFVPRLLADLGLVRCVPVVLSLQQCAGSISALGYAHALCSGDGTADGAGDVLVAAFDRTPDDRDRVTPYALFGDAVTSALVSRRPQEMRLRASAVNLDFPGLSGSDSFASRQDVAVASIKDVLGRGGRTLDEIEKVFATNLYQPLAAFNAMAAGLGRDQLCIDGLAPYGHCRNSDWLINLIGYAASTGLTPGASYLAQASAPGFSACALLEALG